MAAPPGRSTFSFDVCEDSISGYFSLTILKMRAMTNRFIFQNVDAGRVLGALSPTRVRHNEQRAAERCALFDSYL
jgi:hypothetical protein